MVRVRGPLFANSLILLNCGGPPLGAKNGRACRGTLLCVAAHQVPAASRKVECFLAMPESVHHQDWQISVLDHRLGAASKNPLAQARMAIGTHHEQVCAAGFGESAEEFGRRLAICGDDLDLGWDTVPAKLGGGFAYCRV